MAPRASLPLRLRVLLRPAHTPGRAEATPLTLAATRDPSGVMIQSSGPESCRISSTPSRNRHMMLRPTMGVLIWALAVTPPTANCER